MTDNEERLKGLQEGENHSKAAPQNATAEESRTSNDAKLNRLQESEQGGRQSATPRIASWDAEYPNPAAAAGTRNPTIPSVKRLLDQGVPAWIGLGLVVVVGVVVMIIVGLGLVNTSSNSPDATSQDSLLPGDQGSSIVITTDQGPPQDIPALAALVIQSAVLIDCPSGLGTGFLLDVEPLTGVSNDSIIVTNQHVIEGCEGANDLTVSNMAGTSKGSAIDYDADLDLAIIEAPAITGQPLTIGKLPLIGQWAMAVGNPEGITDTATFGNITNVKINDDEEFILSDVLLGPGNSGGPLVDNQGKVLGINTAVLKTADGFSFSIPVENLCYSLLKCK